LRLDTGATVRTTSCHSFLVENEWVRASQIRSGSTIPHYSDGGVVREASVLESRLAAEVEDVFNLVVAKNFSFVADGVPVHSFSYMRQARAAAWRIVGRFHAGRLIVPSFSA
jgi:intein/homing endonuclease